jgi:tripartite-type tricarboxylate transporter receptor subunit TctC
LTVMVARAACGQEYPVKPVRIITLGAGGSSDFTSRLLAPGLTASLGKPVIIENREGGGIIFGELLAKAPPDGYTLLVIGANIWIEPLFRKAAYDSINDFSPVSLLVSSPSILAVHPSVPVKSVPELIALAKSKPGALNYAAGPQGSTNHLGGELFKSLAGINMTAIFYKSTGQAFNDLISGQVQVMISNAGGITPHIKSGRVRALATTSAGPSLLAPGLPAMAATVPNYVFTGTLGMLAPPRTPAAVVSRLNREVVRLLNQADVKERLLNSGLESVGSSPEDYAAAVRSEMSALAGVIKSAGIRLD